MLADWAHSTTGVPPTYQSLLKVPVVERNLALALIDGCVWVDPNL